MPKQLPELLPTFAQRKDSRFAGKIRISAYAGEPIHIGGRALIYRKSENTLTEPKPGEEFEWTEESVAEVVESPFEES